MYEMLVLCIVPAALQVDRNEQRKKKVKEREKGKIQGIGKNKLMRENETMGGNEKGRTEDAERNEREK